MMKCLISALLLLCAISAQAGVFVGFGQGGGDSSYSFSCVGGELVCEDFDGTGAPANWTSAGTINWDYTYAGGEAAYVTGTGTYTYINTPYFDSSLSLNQGIVANFIFEKTSIAAGGTRSGFLSIYSTSGLILDFDIDNSTNDLIVNRYLTGTSGGSFTFVNGTKYYVKVSGGCGTGNSIKLYIDTSPNPTTEVAHANLTVNCTLRSMRWSYNNTATIIDDVRIVSE